MQEDRDSRGRSFVRTYVDRYGGLMDDIEVWRYLAHADEDGTFERIREAGGVYESKEADTAGMEPSTVHEADPFPSGKYRPLYEKLMNSEADTLRFGFAEIEDVLNESLPNSAYQYRQWWNPSGHPHAEGWESIGWTVSSLDLASETVEFKRYVDR